MTTGNEGQERNNGRIFAGLAVILAGLAMLGDRVAGLHGMHLSARYWPLLLIALGLVRLSDSSLRHGRRRSRRGGAWLVFVGVWALLSEWHVLGLDFGTSWPLLVIGAGIVIVWRAFDDPAAGGGPVRES